MVLQRMRHGYQADPSVCYNHIMTSNIEELGVSGNGKTVFLDHSDTHVGYHLLETSDLLDLVREVLPRIDSRYHAGQ
jgi:hypothetical protein